jgi:hypothetical protein
MDNALPEKGNLQDLAIGPITTLLLHASSSNLGPRRGCCSADDTGVMAGAKMPIRRGGLIRPTCSCVGAGILPFRACVHRSRGTRAARAICAARGKGYVAGIVFAKLGWRVASPAGLEPELTGRCELRARLEELLPMADGASEGHPSLWWSRRPTGSVRGDRAHQTPEFRSS